MSCLISVRNKIVWCGWPLPCWYLLQVSSSPWCKFGQNPFFSFLCFCDQKRSHTTGSNSPCKPTEIIFYFRRKKKRKRYEERSVIYTNIIMSFSVDIYAITTKIQIDRLGLQKSITNIWNRKPFQFFVRLVLTPGTATPFSFRGMPLQTVKKKEVLVHYVDYALVAIQTVS